MENRRWGKENREIFGTSSRCCHIWFEELRPVSDCAESSLQIRAAQLHDFRSSWPSGKTLFLQKLRSAIVCFVARVDEHIKSWIFRDAEVAANCAQQQNSQQLRVPPAPFTVHTSHPIIQALSLDPLQSSNHVTGCCRWLGCPRRVLMGRQFTASDWSVCVSLASVTSMLTEQVREILCIGSREHQTKSAKFTSADKIRYRVGCVTRP